MSLPHIMVLTFFFNFSYSIYKWVEQWVSVGASEIAWEMCEEVPKYSVFTCLIEQEPETNISKNLTRQVPNRMEVG